MDVLLTFTGFQDPYTKSLQSEYDQTGPILSLLSVRSFDQVVLFSTPNTLEHTAQTDSAIRARHPSTRVDVRHIELTDPTDYLEILRGVRSAMQNREHISGGDLYVSVASGTPQMHAIWLLLVTSGEIPAQILCVRPRQFVSKDRPIVSMVDLSGAEFPAVQIRHPTGTDSPEYQTADDTVSIAREVGIVGDHPNLLKAIDSVSATAASDVPILILGETGTGKELFARLIHRLSGRAADRFVAL